MAGQPGLISIRSGSGLGDAIYLQSVARYFVDNGHDVEVCTRYPDVFRPLAGRLLVSEFRRDRITRVAHYADRRDKPETTQFEDCCIRAGLRAPTELRLDWKVGNQALAERVKQLGQPVIAVQLPRAPFGDRPDRYGIELLPDCRRIQEVIDRIRTVAAVIQIGSGASHFSFGNLSIDFANRTSVSDLLDLCRSVDGFLGYVSFFVPMAEAMGRPGLFVWSSSGLASRDPLIRTVTPKKIFHGDQCRAVRDDCTRHELEVATDAFLGMVRREAARRG